MFQHHLIRLIDTPGFETLIVMRGQTIMFYIFLSGCRLKDEEHSWAYVQQRGRQRKNWKQFCLIEIPGLGGGGLPPFNKAGPFHVLSTVQYSFWLAGLVEDGWGGGGLPPSNKAAPFHLLLVCIPVPPSQDLACIFPSN